MPEVMMPTDRSGVRGHSGATAPRSSTEEGMVEDERHEGKKQIMEMDGTGMYERGHWVLGSGGQSVARPTNLQERRSPNVEGEQMERDFHFEKRKDSRTKVDIPGCKPEKNDVREAEREGREHNEDNHPDEMRDEGRKRELESQSRRRGTSEASALQESEHPSQSRSPRSKTLAGRPLASSPTAPSLLHDAPDNASKRPRQEISREWQDDSTTSRSRHPDASLLDEDHARTSYADTTDDEDSFCARGPQHDSNGSRINPSPEMDDDVSSRYSGDDSFTPTKPQSNINGHGTHSSISKTTPPQRQRSSRRSPSITTQASFNNNNNKVRYSWQSIQDEEPNRPRIHIIKLVSNTASASAAVPGGEAFGFSISPAGRRIAAYNSARLYVLQTGALPVGVSQDYALKRRPLAVEIIDEGNLIAILADQHTVNLYDLHGPQMTMVRTIKLDFPTTSIALAPTGGLLAAAYEGGIEIFSLHPDALPTDRRAVRSVKMDRMTFSEDGSTLLGTTTRINVSSTVTVSVPVFPSASSNIPTHEELKEAWCSELLHPENIRNSSHATFMRENRATCNDKFFAWNGVADTFGILNINDMQYGNIDFPVVISPPLSTCGGLGAAIHSPPAIDEHGDTVAMIVNDRTIRLYIVPRKVEDSGASQEAHSIDHELDEGYGCPFSEVRWVYSSTSLPAPSNTETQVQGRLIVTSPGGVVDSSMGEEMIDDIEGGRIILFDFDPQFAGQPGQTFSLTLGKNPPQLLEEPQVDVAQEVALVRRRTVNQSRGNGLSQRPITLGRAASTFGGRRERERPRNENGRGTVGLSAAHRRSMISISSLSADASRSLPDLMEGNEAIDTFEEPYAQNAPRSQASLQRAATNAQRHRFQTIEEKSQERVSADSTGNGLPLPEYTEEPNAPLPSRFRAMAGLDTPAMGPKKAAVVTGTDGEHHSLGLDEASTAPAQMGEDFSAEQAFSAALADANRPSAPQEQIRRPDEVTTPTTAQSAGTYGSPAVRTPPSHPVHRNGTLDSMGPMPRSLQRAYGQAPTIIGEWANVSPVSRSSTADRIALASQDSALMNASPTKPKNQARVTVSPVRRGRGTSMERRNDPLPPLPNNSRSATSPRIKPSVVPSAAAGPSSSRRPPRSRFAQRAAANNTVPDDTAAASATADSAAANDTEVSASIFPPPQTTDEVAVRATHPKTGNVPHPVTAWHPPAASTPTLASAWNGGGGIGRHHSRHSSLSHKNAFASTAKARDLGFFKSRRGRTKKRAFDPGLVGGTEGRGKVKGKGKAASVGDNKSMFTFAGREGKCGVM